MSDPAAGPEGRYDEAPWWERGATPEGFALPKRRSRRILATVAIVVTIAGLGMIVWSVVAGAASMASMSM